MKRIPTTQREFSRSYKGWATFLYFFSLCWLLWANFESPLPRLIKFYSGNWHVVYGLITDTQITSFSYRTSRRQWNGYQVNYFVRYEVNGQVRNLPVYFAEGSELRVRSIDREEVARIAESEKKYTLLQVFYKPEAPEIAFVVRRPLFDLLGSWVILGGIGFFCFFAGTIVLIVGKWRNRTLEKVEKKAEWSLE